MAENLSGEEMMKILNSVSAEQLAEVLRSAGCRASISSRQGMIEIHSAVQGLGFLLRMGGGDPAQGHVDFSWICPLAVRGTLARELIDSWNRNTRYGRLTLHDQFLVLSMDTLLAGGVAEAYLGAQFEVWTRLLQQLVLHLRQPSVQDTKAAAAA